MIEIELKTIGEFDELNLPTDDEFLDIIKKAYPKVFNEVLVELNELNKFTNKLLGFAEGKDLDEGELREVYFVEDFVEKFDDIFDDVYDNNEEIMRNYFVCDRISTDRGVWETVVANGYELI